MSGLSNTSHCYRRICKLMAIQTQLDVLNVNEPIICHQCMPQNMSSNEKTIL